MTEVVNISDAKATADPVVTLATYSLGSCIGLSLYDPVNKVGGMLHFQLPTSTMDADRARQVPLMFADTGMAWLLQEMEALGALKRRMQVKLAGAAQMLNDASTFNIGRRNHAAIRKLLWQHGMLIAAEHVGGSLPRNLYLNVSSGGVTMKIANEVFTL